MHSNVAVSQGHRRLQFQTKRWHDDMMAEVLRACSVSIFFTQLNSQEPFLSLNCPELMQIDSGCLHTVIDRIE